MANELHDALAEDRKGQEGRPVMADKEIVHVDTGEGQQ